MCSTGITVNGSGCGKVKGGKNTQENTTYIALQRCFGFQSAPVVLFKRWPPQRGPINTGMWSSGNRAQLLHRSDKRARADIPITTKDLQRRQKQGLWFPPAR